MIETEFIFSRKKKKIVQVNHVLILDDITGMPPCMSGP